jgi:4,5-dihydroxyphthalate decarboxylase
VGNFSLTLATGPYDRVEAIARGFVQPEGLEVTCLQILSPPEIFSRMVKTGAFDMCEMSLSTYLTRRSRGGFPFIALPVFPSRLFRHGYIYVNRKSGISTPTDLNGRCIGVQEYGQTAATWIRGILQDQYAVDWSGITWVEGGVNTPRLPDAEMDLRPLKEVALEHPPPDKSINDLLLAGDIEAYFGARQPEAFGKQPHIQRLFPNYREIEREYFKKTGIFPIMHAIVMREDLYHDKPWIAESMFKAFRAAKLWGLEHMRFTGTMVYMIPWLNAELEEIDSMFHGDPYPYGLKANRHNLGTFLQYLVDQHFVAEPRPALDDLFTPIVGWAE